MWQQQSHVKSRVTDLVTEHNNLVKNVQMQQQKITELSVTDVPFDILHAHAPGEPEDKVQEIQEVEMEPAPVPPPEQTKVTKRTASRKKEAVELK